MFEFINFILHIDQYLSIIIQTYNIWTYAILSLILFLETGLVATPFLPGDSLLFAAGSFAALGALDIIILLTMLSISAIIGDSVNYSIGRYIGPKVFKSESSIFLNKKYLLRTQEFYDKHGKKTIFLARFVPIIRTFAPFIAGIGKMEYTTFLKFNIVGGIVWVSLFLLGGYFFGNLPIVQENFSIVILAIIIISFVPIFIEIFRMRKST